MSLKYQNTIAIFVILIAVILILIFQDRRQECDIHLENFKRHLQSDLYSQKLKTVVLPPRLIGAIKNCKESNNSGACLDVHQTMLKTLEMILRTPKNCYLALAEDNALKGALIQVMRLYTEIAWGETPPGKLSQIGEGSWLGYSDYALFCNIKNTFVQIFGREEFDKTELKLVKDLPGDAPIIEEGKCLNCDFRKKAVDVTEFYEVKKKSLIGINCSRF